jgi:hypothetical protein
MLQIPHRCAVRVWAATLLVSVPKIPFRVFSSIIRASPFVLANGGQVVGYGYLHSDSGISYAFPSQATSYCDLIFGSR